MAETPQAPGSLSDGEEIRQLARQYQYGRYLAALLAPRRHREALIVLAAFAGELQRIPFLTSEPMIAAIRLQWWRDELSAAAAHPVSAGEGQRTGHLLCDTLLDVARTYRLPLGLLQGMIDAAETELDAAEFAQEAETQQVLIKFQGAMFELAGRVLGIEAAPRETWITAAFAYGAAQWAAEAQWRRTHGLKTYLSRDLAAQTGRRVFVAMAGKALDELRAAMPFNRPLRTTLLPLAVVAPLLRAVERSVEAPQAAGQQANVTIVGLSEFAQAHAILWAHWRGRF